MAKMGYPSIAMLSANIKSAHMISRILDLHKTCSATVVEFDNDASSQTGVKGATDLCRILCENGVDAVPSTTGMFVASLPQELKDIDGLDISDIVRHLGVEEAASRFEEKFCALLGRNLDGTVTREPLTFLRKVIHAAESQTSIDEMYKLLAAQPPMLQVRYFKAITTKLAHKEKDILKNLKRFKGESSNEGSMTLHEDEGVTYYHNPSQSYKFYL
jgi:hypothetical protein